MMRARCTGCFQVRDDCEPWGIDHALNCAECRQAMDEMVAEIRRRDSLDDARAEQVFRAIHGGSDGR